MATYADIITPAFMSAAHGRWAAIDRGTGDPHNVATIADIEPGALSVASARAKIVQWNAEHRPFPTAYHNRSIWGEVNTELKGISYSHWLATLDGTLVPDGYYMAAVQFAGERTLGFHADMSIVWADNWKPIPESAPSVPVAGLKTLAAQATAALANLTAAVDRL